MVIITDQLDFIEKLCGLESFRQWKKKNGVEATSLVFAEVEIPLGVVSAFMVRVIRNG
jgi:hypothetical protein